MGETESKPVQPAASTYDPREKLCFTRGALFSDVMTGIERHGKDEFEKPWRNFNWNQKSELKKHLEEFSLSNPDVQHIKILVAGPIGTGKSSFINSVNNVFQGRITADAPVNSSSGDGRSFTTTLKGHYISRGKIPLVFVDIMGLEPDTMAGSQPEDIIKAVFGHVKDGYKFDESKPLSHKDQHYTDDPSLSDQAFCLVYAIPANTVNMTDDKLIDKLKIIRHRISEKRIPQVIVMTKVDEACPLVKEDLKKMYYSKKIKEKMQVCHDKLGVPMCNIFPVKNYHDEIDTDDDVDVLILKALDQIVRLADDRLFNSSDTV
ncbi:interferon-induced protein 44-like [Triplophysa dalaica]|uniref:interferon-induced protein 44-like n=1 Tax=Triplophysa dalaica TaxID=1582913 RepID=UPI0024E03518|nr:interferon-induced protein 44-like [Triplophysa dalaica]